MKEGYRLSKNRNVVLSQRSTQCAYANRFSSIAKLRGSMRTVRVEGTTRFPCAADRRRWEPLPNGEIISARYEGASPRRHL